jgi:hypothetical protein
MEESIFVDEGV